VAPTVTGISATTGNPGDKLTVTGTGFLGGTALGFEAVGVGFGGAPPNDGVVSSDTQLTVTVPAGPSSGTSIHVTVTGPGGASQQVPVAVFTYN
jgi:hypothetical protein